MKITLQQLIKWRDALTPVANLSDYVKVNGELITSAPLYFAHIELSSIIEVLSKNVEIEVAA